ncbi:hypothetical protein, partial [Rhizobium leguminosarum]|uniref:hypothetical protein n=1 Tax=Rhizobium leguminosarum TaxID=384 RepID=UPI00197FE2E1
MTIPGKSRAPWRGFSVYVFVLRNSGRKTWGNRGAITPGHIYKMMAGVVAPDKMEKRAHDWNRAQTSNG